MRLFALYLPQFHETPENNKWWGKGFTEWTNVKKATPLFPGHLQPIAPLDGNYYNLLDKETVSHQTRLMKEYGITGMIYYHYYFCGKKLLYKPAENLLQWKDIDQPFFFCWANHTWNRAWKGSREVLIEQTYGTESDWKAHFNYLLPFFMDTRYEKKENKPVLMIYQNFPEKKPMLACFDAWCRENGFDGIYIIEECFRSEPEAVEQFMSTIAPQTEKIYLTEPLCGRLLAYDTSSFILQKWRRLLYKLRQAGILKTVETYNGNLIYKTLLKKKTQNKKLIRGLFFQWDNTPRHSTRGYIITPPSKERFMAYAKTLRDDEYVFINAWNEWAEGMVLEPTVHNGYRYLQWVKELSESTDWECI